MPEWDSGHMQLAIAADIAATAFAATTSSSEIGSAHV